MMMEGYCRNISGRAADHERGAPQSHYALRHAADCTTLPCEGRGLTAVVSGATHLPVKVVFDSRAAIVPPRRTGPLSVEQWR